MKTAHETVKMLSEARFFEGASIEALEDFVNKGQIVHFPGDEVIIEEGEYELICYVIISGTFEVWVTDKESGRRNHIQTLGRGELLGEMAVLSGSPRAAEVICVEDSYLLRIGRQTLLNFLDAAPAVKERIDAGYRKRALVSALKMIDFFSSIAEESISDLASKVELVVFQKDEMIFNIGEQPEGFYFIRDGFVKVSRHLGEQEGVFFDSRFDKRNLNPAYKKQPKEYIMAYMGPGAFFGERALLHDRPRSARTTAMSRVELVRIAKADFMELMSGYPEVLAGMKDFAETHYAVDAGAAYDQELLSWAAEHDVLSADAVLILDLNLCVRCLNCIDACAGLHDGITRITHNGVRYKNILIPTSCRHCREPVCMIGCPTGAIQRDVHGEVYHMDTCIGCGNCARRCPFGNISIVDKGGFKGLNPLNAIKSLIEGSDGGEKKEKPKLTRKAVKCDLCMDYDYMGCLHNCPTGAIMSVKPSKHFAKAGR